MTQKPKREVRIDPAGPRYPIESVANAARVLTLLADRGVVRVSDVARLPGISVSAAHRLLTTLEAAGMLSQDPVSRCYGPGPALYDVAAAVSPARSRWEFARPYLAGLSARLGMTVNLSVLSGSDVVFVESVEALAHLRVGSRVGAIMAAHCTSGGKVLLSLLDRDQLDRLYPSTELHKLTTKSIGTVAGLKRELQAVRRRGFATNFGESESQVSAVSVAVPESPRLGRSALAVSVPGARLAPGQVRDYVRELHTTANALDGCQV